MADAGRRDQGGVHQSAGTDHDPTLIELTRDRLEQGPVQATAHQLGAEARKGGALRRPLMGGKAAEPAKAGSVLEGFGQAHVGQVVPGRQQEGAEERQRRPARLALGRS
jgi:hypothetical protein